MTKKQRIFLSIAAFMLLGLFFFIIVSEQGLVDLIWLKEERDKLVEKNTQISRENHSISIQIERLKNDPTYIENIARRELGMIAEDEIILKPKRPTEQK